MSSWEICLPSRGVSPHGAPHLACLLEDLGYGGVWATEVAGHDAVALLAAIATQASRVRLGTAIIPCATRSPALLAMGVAALAHLAPGRSTVGLGVSSRVIIEEWHDRSFSNPLSAMSDVLSIIQQAFSGDARSITVASLVLAASHSRTGQRPDRTSTLPRSDQPCGALRPSASTVSFLTSCPGRGAKRSWHRRLHPDASRSRRWFAYPSRVKPQGGAVDFARSWLPILRLEQYSRWLAGLGYGDAVAVLNGASEPEERMAQVPDDLSQDVSVIGDAGSCRAQLQRMCEAAVTPLVIPDVPVGDMVALERVIRAIAPVQSALARSSVLENAG